jgi:hypothetical protein
VADWDWVTISALATAFGTLVLAIATFASVRSANTSARTAERALLQGIRPLVFVSRFSDEQQKVFFADGHLLHVPGGHGAVAVTPDAAYLAISLRNVGTGVAVLHGWVVDRRVDSGVAPDHAPLDRFRRLTRDLYVPPHDVLFWQAAIRDPSDPTRAVVEEAVRTEDALAVELLYGDEEGGQRTVTRFALVPHRAEDGSLRWLATVGRHWYVDRAAPR